jgi:hypothetical protein
MPPRFQRLPSAASRPRLGVPPFRLRLRAPARARSRRPGLARLALLLLLPGLAPTAARAQSLTIAEYRELILSSEGTLARLDRDLQAANVRLDRLVAEKQAAGSARGPRSRELAAEIVDVSQRVADLERQRRAALADQAALREALNQRYTQLIDANLARLDSLPQSDPDYSPLLVETGRIIGARDSLQLQIRIQQTLGSFRDFPILDSDGPAEIREKAGFYRDYVHDVAQRIAAIDREIETIRERDRVARRMKELQEDLAFQGEDVAKRRTDPSGGDIREDPARGALIGIDLLNQSPERRIADLEEEKRSLQLLRGRFEARVREYEDRARTIYIPQTTQSGEENR